MKAMYIFGALLMPIMAVAGIGLVIAGASGNTGNRDMLAIAGAILLGAVLIAGTRDRSR